MLKPSDNPSNEINKYYKTISTSIKDYSRIVSSLDYISEVGTYCNTRTYEDVKSKYMTLKDIAILRKHRIKSKAMFRALQGVNPDLDFIFDKKYFTNKNYEDLKARGLNNIVFLTLTSKYNNKKELHEAFRRFIRNLRYYLYKRGQNIRYFAVIEQNKNLTYYHIHIIAFLNYVPQKVISNIWRKATKGTAFIVDIRQIKLNRKERRALKDKTLRLEYFNKKFKDYIEALKLTVSYVNKYITKGLENNLKGSGRHYWYSKLWKLEGNKLYERITRIGLNISKNLAIIPSWFITYEVKKFGLYDYIKKYGFGSEALKKYRKILNIVD